MVIGIRSLALALSLSTWLAALTAASPVAKAAKIVQVIPTIQDAADYGRTDLVGSLFDPALGTLKRVTGELTGIDRPVQNFTSGCFLFPCASPATLEPMYRVNTGAEYSNFYQGSFRDQSVVPAVYTFPDPYVRPQVIYTGTPIHVHLHFDFPVLDFIGGDASDLPSQLCFGVGGACVLAAYWFHTPINPNPDGGSEVDDTSFVGTFRLTYFYSVPEPASLGLFASGLVGLLLITSRRRPAARRFVPPAWHRCQL